jgi:hypothetical protein
MSSRLDSKLEAEGAEFLVLGHLLIEGIAAHKGYTRHPGHDLLAVDAETGRACRIQVKSRWATDWDRGVPIKNFESEFVVVVALNRGWRGYAGRPAPANDDGRRPPEFWVIPTELMRSVVRTGTWSKVRLRDIDDVDQYRDAWHRIRDHLSR